MKKFSGGFALLVGFSIALSACGGGGATVAPPTSTTDEPLTAYPRPEDSRRISKLGLRSAQEVCDRWNQDHPSISREQFYPGLDFCDPGTPDPIAQEDALRRINLFRWLAGLRPVKLNEANSSYAQAAARIMDANGQLSHFPDASWKCWSQEGYTGAGKSNIAIGYQTAADTVDGYIRDDGDNNAAVGHRRWLLHPDLVDVGVGHYGKGGAIWIADKSIDRESPELVTHPSPGFYPLQAIEGTDRWSLSVFRLPKNSPVSVKVTTPWGVERPNSYEGERGSGLETIVFNMGEERRTGKHKIEVRLGKCIYVWESTIVDCSKPETFREVDVDPVVTVRCK